jgi:hypothetical protein
MKTRKNLYQVLGILFIALDILLTCSFAIILKRRYRHINYTAALLPLQVLLVPALLFIVLTFRVQKKIRLQERKSLESAFTD